MNPIPAEQWLRQLTLAHRLCAGFSPTTLVIAAHPGDEIIALSSHLRLWPAVAFAHLTDGAPRNMIDAHREGYQTRPAYAQARSRELLLALDAVGHGKAPVRPLNFIDQEASLRLFEVARRTLQVFEEINPSVVITHPYEGGHPDHDAAAFGVHIACRKLRLAGRPAPALLELSSYHSGPKGFRQGQFLPSDQWEFARVLSGAEREFKHGVYRCLASQAQVLKLFPPEVERLRVAPAYDFQLPPHEGELFYEKFSWGMTGTLWRALAMETLHELELLKTA